MPPLRSITPTLKYAVPQAIRLMRNTRLHRSGGNACANPTGVIQGASICEIQTRVRAFAHEHAQLCSDRSGSPCNGRMADAGCHCLIVRVTGLLESKGKEW